MATIIWGVINPDGSIQSGSKTNGSYNFNIVHQSSGVYQIQFDDDFNVMPAMVGSQVLFGNLAQSPLDNVVFPYLNENGATAITGDSNGSHTDRHFSFIATGD